MDKVREQAMLALYEVEKRGAYSNMALKEIFGKNKDLAARDKAFITTLVYGTLKRQITIDYIIGCYSKVKLKKISPYIIVILRMGIYQLGFMDKVPESAAVNESVALAKRYGHKASAGFINGVLRNFVRNGYEYPKDKDMYMSVKYSFPQWICKMWCEDYGEDFAKELMESMNGEPMMSLRINTLKTDAEKVSGELGNARISDVYDYALLSGGFDISNSKLYKAGYITAQDISAMTASAVLAPKPGERVLDLCAAPGGKTTHMAHLMENKGSITACDIHAHKLDLIDGNAMRMGIDIIQTVCIDASKPIAQWRGRFDKVLADVPCSGLGIIRKKPDIKLKEEENLCGLQYAILQRAAEYLRPGGELVYSTCTLNRRENEEIVEKFLKENKGFAAVDMTDILPKRFCREEAGRGHITLFPNIDGTDGFFIAKIKRCTDD